MARVKTILAAADHAQRNGWAETRAVMLGAELGAATLEVLSVAPSGERLARALDAAARMDECGAGSSARTTLGPGRVRAIGFGAPADVVARRAAELRADLVVVSMRAGRICIGMHAAGDGLELLRSLECPLLLVRQEPHHAYRRTLLATDFGPSAFAAAELGMALAPRSRHTLIHALAAPAGEACGGEGVVHLPHIRASAAANRRMNEQAAVLARSGQELERVLRCGDPGTEILDCARRLDADLVALGRAGAGAAGKVTVRLLRELECDLLIVPGAADDWDGGIAA